MKKLLFSLILCFLCNNIFAQEIEIYHTFLGLPIEGNGEIFANKLVEKGFQITNRNDDEGKIFLSGKYDNLDCNLELQHVAHINRISSLQVQFVTDSTSITPQERAIFKKIYSTHIAPYQDRDDYEIVCANVAQIDTVEMASAFISKRISEDKSYLRFSIDLLPQYFSITYYLLDEVYDELLNNLKNSIDDYFKTRDTYYFKGIPIEGDTKTFAQKLIAQGYKLNNLTTLYDEFILLEGKFFGENVTINISGDSQRNIKFIVVDFLQKSYLSEYRPNLYRRIRNSLIEKYPKEDHWIYLEEDEDISNLSDKEMYRQSSIYDKRYMFRIFDNPNVQASPYIALVLGKNGLMLFYKNPNTAQQISSQESDDL